MAIQFRPALFACPQCGTPVASYHDDFGDNPASYRAPTHWTFEPCGHKFREFAMDLDTGIITRFIPFHPNIIERNTMATPCPTCGQTHRSSRSMCPTCYPKPSEDTDNRVRAAAPELLASLIEFVQCNDGEHTLEMYQRARAVIAKAEKGGA